MSNASLENSSLTLNKLIINNSLYSDASGYIASNTTFTTSKDSITVNNLTIDNFTAQNFTTDNFTTDNFTALGITNISGIFFGSITGPIACVGNASTLFQRTYSFPSSAITKLIVTVNSISTSSGTIFGTGIVIAPYSSTLTTIQYNFYNPTASIITVNNASVIIYNATGSGGLQNIV